MRRVKFLALVLATSSLVVCAERLNAQTVGYAQAIDQFAIACSKDIDKFCKTTNLGGGRVQQCLDQNEASVSATCKATISNLKALLRSRAAARASVMRVCERDILRLCSGIQPGDGNLLECFFKAQSRVSANCQRAVADAGYDVSLGAAPASGKTVLSSAELVNSLQDVEAAAANISAASLRRLVEQGIRDPSRANPVNRAPLSAQLGALAQITIAVNFDFDSARIRPDSFRAVGLMADSLYHPYLQGYRFLIVGHTDAKGGREYNLRLSQRRADAIREALINPFGISPARIEAVGLGEEQLLNRSDPYAAQNRRVQLINIGK